MVISVFYLSRAMPSIIEGDKLQSIPNACVILSAQFNRIPTIIRSFFS